MRLSRLHAPVVAAIVTTIGTVLACSPALAQCAMCGLSKGEEDGTAAAFLAGALVLALPTAAIIGGVAWATWRHRNP